MQSRSITKAQKTSPVEPLAYRVNDASSALGIGRTKLYELAATGKIRMIKVAGRTIIPADSLRDLIKQTA